MRITLPPLLALGLFLHAGFAAAETDPAADAKKIRELTAQLKDADWSVRYRAAQKLEDMGPAAAAAVPDLIKALQDEQRWVRDASAVALGAIGPDATKAVPALLAALRDPTRVVRTSAAAALVRIGPADDETVPALVRLLMDPDAAVRLAAARALRMGKPAREAVPALAEAARDADGEVRQAALEALEEAGFTVGRNGEVVRLPAPPPPRSPQAQRLAARPDKPFVEVPWAKKYLRAGQLADCEKALAADLLENSKDDQARFGLGTVQFLRAVEHLSQSLYHYGVRSDRGRQLNIPFLRLPVPDNPKPERLTYPAARRVLQDLVADLEKAETTLAAVRDDGVKLPLRVGLIRLDLDGDGKPDEYLAKLLAQYMGGRSLPGDGDVPVVFDRGDVAWLRGYCHLLMAMAEVALAHDAQELFDCTAHLFFANVDTPHKFLTEGDNSQPFFGLPGDINILDAIALIHVIRLPVKEPERLKAALGHLEKMLALSKESWRYILAETDDDYEWIPNPRQTGALGVPVTQEMAESWLAFLDETEQILAGKRLIPFWRGREERGVNLRRAFTEPRTFDLVLWFQGTAATPYLEKGPLTRPEVWARLQRVFGGEFIGFALWFN
jgi:hypothetical protein